jgi:hypothetical protein
MARLAIGTAPEMIRLIAARWRAAGFATVREAAEGGIALAVAEKRVRPVTNLRREGGGDWTAAVGTWCRDGEPAGAAALAALARDFDARGAAARDRLIGHFSAAFRRGGRVTVVCDGLASHFLYYGQDERGRALVSTSLLDFAFLFPGPWFGQAEDVLSSAVFGHAGMDGTTAVPGVGRLLGPERLVLRPAPGGAEAPALTVERAPGPRTGSAPGRTMAEALGWFRALSDRAFAGLGRYPLVGVHATGGLDSRLIVANAMRHRLPVQLRYGVGNSALTNTKAADLDAARALARATGWPLRVMDWSGGEMRPRAERERLLFEHGLLLSYGGASGFLAELAGGSDPFPDILVGGQNPAFLNLGRPWEMDRLPRSAGEIARLVSARPAASARDPEAFRRAVARQVTRHLERHLPGADPEALAPEEASETLIRLRSGREAVILNFYNEFYPYLAPYFTTELFAFLLSLPAAWRRDDHFQIAAIDDAAPAMLDVPVFSGSALRRVDREALRVAAVEGTARRGLAARLPEPLAALAPRGMVRRWRRLRDRRRGRGDLSWRLRFAVRDALAGTPAAAGLDVDDIAYWYPQDAFHALNMAELGALAGRLAPGEGPWRETPGGDA